MIELYPHNALASEKVAAHFSAGNRKAAVVHATGTGKSYIAATVARNYHNVLVLAPMDIILDEMRRAMEYRNGVTYLTYTYLLYIDDIRTDYDLIILDEYHRAGAEKWGQMVQSIIESNQDAKLLGLSATNIRYLDHNRNMADELFDGQVVSRLTLADAMRQDILPTPTLVECIYSFDETEEMLRERIANSRMDEAWKQERMALLQRSRLKWEESDGVVGILRRYITHDIRRAILFCRSIERAHELEVLVGSWLTMAGISDFRFYHINCLSKTLSDDLAAYRSDDDFSGLKIACAINMLNEGVHIEGVDCIIMLRNTESRIIIEQQLGRCLTANNNGKSPLVLDMVSNVKYVYRAKRNYGNADNLISVPDDTDSDNGDIIDKLPFTVIDETIDIKEFIDNTFPSFETRKRWFMAFVQQNNRLPMAKDKEYLMYDWMTKNKRRDDDIMATYKRFHTSEDERHNAFIEFVSHNNRLPLSNGDGNETTLYDWMTHRGKKMYKDVNDYYLIYRPNNDQRARQLADEIERTHRLPAENRDILWIRNHRHEYPELDSLCTKYSRKAEKRVKEDETKAEAIAFIEKYGRLPKTNIDSERNLYHRIKHIRHKCKEFDKEIERMSYLTTTYKRNLNNLRDFCQRTGTVPTAKTDSVLYSFCYKHSRDEEVAKILSGCMTVYDARRQQYAEEVKAFVDANGRMPNSRKGKHEELLYRYLYDNKWKHPILTEIWKRFHPIDK